MMSKNRGKALALGLGLSATMLNAYTAEPYVRFSLRVLDSAGKEVRFVTPGTNRVAYTLEGYAENIGSMEKPIVTLAWTMDKAPEMYMTQNLQPNPHYGLEDFFYPYEMASRNNTVGSTSDSNVRSTTIFNPDGTLKNKQEGRTTGGGVFARHTFYVPAVITNFFTEKISHQTNFVLRTISYERAESLESHGDKKLARARSLLIAVMPADYAGVHLVPDRNNGQLPANDWIERDLRGGIRHVNYSTQFGFEPFYAIGPKAQGNYVLQRSTTDVTGPWTTLTNIAPGNAASYYDGEATTNGWKNVFYRLVSEKDVKAATTSVTTSPARQ